MPVFGLNLIKQLLSARCNLKFIRMKHENSELKILVVDDDEASQMLIDEVLGDLNIIILQAFNVTETYKLFAVHSSEIVLVLMDIHLPEYSGWEVCQQLRKS